MIILVGNPWLLGTTISGNPQIGNSDDPCCNAATFGPKKPAETEGGGLMRQFHHSLDEFLVGSQPGKPRRVSGGPLKIPRAGEQ